MTFFLTDIPLSFTSQLGNKEAIAGETVTLTTDLSKPDMPVIWLKNNQPLSLAGGRFQTVNQDCTHQLIIPDVTKNDSGEYTVEVGELQSTAQLTVFG